ncbi:MAG: SGNH/GDSL hydrolase family protein [Planctomycetota bacterium]|nr:MAG: SGNH/GDSL hydrolase family protein [Planctomycetota bacterium]
MSGCNEIAIPDPAVLYIAFGDSMTAGPSQRDYPDILRELLGQAPETFANEGKSGERPGEGLERLRSLISLGIYPNAHTLFYWEGGGGIIDFIVEFDQFLLRSPDDSDYPYSSQLNEKLNTVQTNIETAIQQARAAGLTVYIATYFSTPEIISRCDPLLLNIILPGQARNANAYMALLNQRIRQAAVNQGAILIDVAAIDDTLHADNSNFFDCSHLSAKGNEIVAGLFFEAVNTPQ